MTTENHSRFPIVDRADAQAILAWSGLFYVVIAIFFLLSQLDYFRRIEVRVSKFEDICVYSIQNPRGRGDVDRFSDCNAVPTERAHTVRPAGRAILDVPLGAKSLPRPIDLYLPRFVELRATGTALIAPIRFEQEHIRFASDADYRHALNMALAAVIAVPVVIVWIVRRSRIEKWRPETSKVTDVQT